MKKNIFIILAIMTIILMPVSVYAKASDDSHGKRQNITRHEKNINRQITKLKSRADRKIRKNIDMLESLIDRVSTARRLESDEKKALIDEIKADIDGQKYLKIKIHEDSDLASLKSDIRLIMSRGSILGKYLPRINGN